MRIAIVTGASSGIGREFAKQIPKVYKQLDELWVVSRSTLKLESLKKEVSIPIRIFDGDMQRDYIYERITRELERQKADIRMLVNCAGYGKIGDFGSLDTEEQLGMINLNCRALTKLTKLCLPYLSKGSRIIQIASAAAFAPQPGFAVYAATKSYVYSFSLALRWELREKEILVTAVCPGPVDTAFFERAEGDAGSTKEALRVRPEEVVKKALADSKKGKAVSVYGMPIKAARAAAKFVPKDFAAMIMQMINKRG